MDGNNPSMLAALLGHAPVVKNFVAGPGVTTTTTPDATGTTTRPRHRPTATRGVWNQSPVTFTPVDLASLPDAGEGEPAGALTDFATDDPADTCLAAGGTLAVSELVGEPGVFLVRPKRRGTV